MSVQYCDQYGPPPTCCSKLTSFFKYSPSSGIAPCVGTAGTVLTPTLDVMVYLNMDHCIKYRNQTPQFNIKNMQNGEVHSEYVPLELIQHKKQSNNQWRLLNRLSLRLILKLREMQVRGLRGGAFSIPRLLPYERSSELKQQS